VSQASPAAGGLLAFVPPIALMSGMQGITGAISNSSWV
jgi:hypothetical protein